MKTAVRSYVNTPAFRFAVRGAGALDAIAGRTRALAAGDRLHRLDDQNVARAAAVALVGGYDPEEDAFTGQMHPTLVLEVLAAYAAVTSCPR